MNCPYCDESIHPQAKYCAKCGLPLKEDTTVHGVSAADDTGPNKIVIGGLLGGIAVIGLLIVALGNQKPSDTQQVRQPEPPRGYAAPGLGTGIAGSRPPQSAFNNAAQAARPAYQAPRGDANTTSQTRYVYTPPPRVPVAAYKAPEPTPPPVPLLAMTTAGAAKPGRVSVVRANTPPVPRLPDSVLSAAMPAMPDVVEPTATENGEPVNPNPNLYVWDPVHERWAKRQDAARRRPAATRTRRPGNAIRLVPNASPEIAPAPE